MNIVKNQEIPLWIRRLEEGDLQFVKELVLASGSLKQLAAEYEVSYPTIRQRLNRVIDRIQLIDANPTDGPFESRVRTLVADRILEPSIGKELLKLHRDKVAPNDQANP